MHTLTDARAELVRVLAAYHALGSHCIDLLCAATGGDEWIEDEVNARLAAELGLVPDPKPAKPQRRRKKPTTQTSLF